MTGRENSIKTSLFHSLLGRWVLGPSLHRPIHNMLSKYSHVGLFKEIMTVCLKCERLLDIRNVG